MYFRKFTLKIVTEIKTYNGTADFEVVRFGKMMMKSCGYRFKGCVQVFLTEHPKRPKQKYQLIVCRIRVKNTVLNLHVDWNYKIEKQIYAHKSTKQTAQNVQKSAITL